MLRGHDMSPSPIMHAPQERAVLEDCPTAYVSTLQPSRRRTLDGEPRPRSVLLPVLRNSDALGHRGLRHPRVPQYMREGDHGCERAVQWVELGP